MIVEARPSGAPRVCTASLNGRIWPKMFPTDPELSRWTILRREPEFTIAQLILWFFVAMTSLQVIMRYLFDAPLQWPEELTQILLVWMTFIAAVGLSRQGLHIRVEILENFLGLKGRNALEAVFNLMTIAFMLALMIGGWAMYEQLSFERTAALRWKLNMIYAVVPLSAAAMFAVHLWQLVGNLRSLFGTRRNGS
jgi:TRAP-type C4-dicarboxylate transport system permease small subunit